MSRLTTLVTGASSGIGREIARCAARHGDEVVLVARRRALLEELADELRAAHGSSAHVVELDVTTGDAVPVLRSALDDLGLTVDVLVNNAGLGASHEFVSQSPDDIDTMIQLNMRSLTLLAREFVPVMVEKGWGRILNVASTSAYQPGPGMAVYHASKAYVLSLGEALDFELKGTGVHVTTLCPRMTESEFFEVAGVRRTTALQRILADPADVASAGYRGAIRGRRVVIPGVANKVLAYGSSILPRRLTTRLTAALLKQA